MSLLDVCIIIIVFIIGYNLKHAGFSFDRRDKKFLNRLFFYHFVVAVVFSFMVAQGGGDAIVYWDFPKNNDLNAVMNVIERGSASGTIYLLNYFFSNVLDLSFLTGNIIYALVGYLGFIYFYKITKSLFPDFSVFENFKLFGVPLFPWIWFLPNLHFWSSGIGKDTLLFLCIALFTYSLLNLKKRFIGLLIAVVLSLTIRPHITMFLIIAFGLAYTMDGRLKGYQKLFIGAIFIASFASIFNYVMDFVQLESLETTTIENYTAKKAANLNQADSSTGLDISGYPYPLKVFTFLYRPLFFDINSVLAILASIENLILLLFTFLIFRNHPWRSFRKGNYLIKGSILFFLMGALSFSLILGNLGIMLRQKNMFYPLFLIFGFWAYYYTTTTQLNTNYADSTSNQ
ncbi:MAG: hypothetical protein HKN48_12840 [Flavobacteriaceae bacterium]|nr:hypothetical protein [Flavobacteriaceae bacterium]